MVLDLGNTAEDRIFSKLPLTVNSDTRMNSCFLIVSHSDGLLGIQVENLVFSDKV